jgi:hypothetical protein
MQGLAAILRDAAKTPLLRMRPRVQFLMPRSTAQAVRPEA